MMAYRHVMPVRRQPLVEKVRSIIAGKPSWGCKLVREALAEQGVQVGRHRFHRLWKAEKLQVIRRKSRKKIRTGKRLNPVPVAPNSVWCTDFAEDRAGGKKAFFLLVKDEATGFGLTCSARASWKGVDVEEELERIAQIHGYPKSIRSDNGGQYISFAVYRWARRHGVEQAFIDPGKPWQNGAAESLVATLRRELLDIEHFPTLEVAQILAARWLRIYNEERPHCRAKGRPPVTAYKHAQVLTA
jgi:putative transposase